MDIAPRLQTLSVEEPAKRKVIYTGWVVHAGCTACPVLPVTASCPVTPVQLQLPPSQVPVSYCMLLKPLLQGGVMVSSAADLVDKLRNEAKVI